MILTLRHYFRAGLRGWPWIVAGVLLVTTYMVWSALVTPVRYEARIAFVVNDNKSDGGGLGSILGQITLGGGGGGGANLQRIKSFVTSRQLINDLLLTETEIDGRQDLVANHLVAANHLVEAFEIDTTVSPARLSTDSIPTLSIKERYLLKGIYNYLAFNTDRSLTVNIDVVTDELIVIVRTQSEELSLYLAETLFTRLTEFYTEEAVAPSRVTVERLQVKADSVLAELEAADYQLANFGDTQLSLMRQRDRIRSVQLNRKITILSTAYGEIVRNLETAKFSLDAVTPYFKLVEAPFRPLDRRRKDPWEAALYGALIGAFVGFLVAAAVRFYHDVMSNTTVA